MTETLTLFEEIFSEGGLLSKTLPSYESRTGQQIMAKDIWEAFEEDATCLFEAGTGIGKSLAYLIPSLLWSHQTKEKVVISTYTIALQEQLLEKDIPMLMQILGLKLNVVMAKGMGNYLCKKRLEEFSTRNDLLEGEEKIIQWAGQTGDGSKSSLPFHVSNQTWSNVRAESEGCIFQKCPHYKSCFFFQARHQVQDADVVIVNHHLLMAHLQAEEKRAILPSFSRLIIDEAHHLESVARSSLTTILDRVQLFRTMARIHSDNHPEVSRFLHLRDLVPKEKKGLSVRLGIDLPGEKRELVNHIQKAFDALHDFFVNESPAQKWRITDPHFLQRKWANHLIPAFEEVEAGLKRYIASLESLHNEFKQEERAEADLLDIASCVEKLQQTIQAIDAFFERDNHDGVRWAEKGMEGTTLQRSTLDVATYLAEKLFSPLKTAILCSATLTVDGQFDHLERDLGLKAEKKKLLPSPFDFQERTRLFGVCDLPSPSSHNFAREAAGVIDEAVQASGGGAFVLFTSYEMLERCAKAMRTPNLLKQGDLSRHLLLEKFKESKNGILLGTDSFWEGVDVAGDALRLVIIVKLPFPVPTEPLLEAKAEMLKMQGRDPFNNDSVPQAVMKFKQGFGRLMRRASDRGCVLCLDERLFTRGYGKVFLRSLPECMTNFAPKRQIQREMETFYQRSKI